MIDFWISIGNTYSYLSVMRLKSVEAERGVSFRRRPFSVRAIIFAQQHLCRNRDRASKFRRFSARSRHEVAHSNYLLLPFRPGRYQEISARKI